MKTVRNFSLVKMHCVRLILFFIIVHNSVAQNPIKKRTLKRCLYH